MLNELLRLALLSSLALLLALAIRASLRRFFGAAAAYQCWLIVPLVTIVACLPTRSTRTIHVTPALRSVRTMAAQLAPAPSFQVDMLLTLWIVGALALACWFIHAHRAFVRAAGPLRCEDGIHLGGGTAGPAAVGLFRPIIIVPHDFRRRYTPAEQVLVLAHEHAHIARRDALANLLQAVFQCVFWFNPLVHVAAPRFRQDQELSCDAIVMAQHPRQRRSYAEALLKSNTTHPRQHAVSFATHPIKERLMQLQLSSPHRSRRIAGRCLVGILALSAMFGALTARAEQPVATYSVAMTIDADGAQSAPRVLARGGEQFAVATGPWRIEMTVRAAPTAGNVWVAGKIYKDATVISAPTLLARLNDNATIKVGDSSAQFALSMVVSQVP